MLSSLRRTVTLTKLHWRCSGQRDVRQLCRTQLSLGWSGSVGELSSGLVLSNPLRALSTERAAKSTSKQGAAMKQRYNGQRRPSSSGFAVVKEVAPLLDVYRRLHGNCKVPVEFVVPSSTPWPEEFFGYRFGEQVDKLRRMKNLLSSNDIKRLEEVGMIWSIKRFRFDQIFRALLTYKSQHGDVNVPADFEVSHGDTRWDRELWGMHLGELVQDVCNGRLYWNFRSQFETLGLAVKEKRPPPAFEAFRRIFAKYHELHGHCHVPFDYVIAPNDANYERPARGMPLGRLVQRIIRGSLYREHWKDFEQMGISINELRRVEVDKVCAAVRCYQKLFGETTSIPLDYEVPSDSTAFPESLWGLPLGRYVMDIGHGNLFEEHRDLLHAAGVPLTRPASTSDFGQEIRTVESLLSLYRSVFHHSYVLPSFTVPPVAPWPLKWHGHPLGKDVDLLRHNRDNLSAEAVQRLGKVGMVWALEKFTVDQIMRALKTYESMRGSLDINLRFSIPYGSNTWDRDLWGMGLGSAVRDILFHDKYRAYRSRFESLGLTFDHCDVSKYTFDMVKQALNTYQTINDTLDVPASYTIGRADAAYAKNLRGMSLGYVVGRIREQGLFAERVNELKAMGFPFKSKRKLEAEQICEGVRCYRRLFGDGPIAYSYQIPKGTEAFPRELWGFPLGMRLNSVCKRGHLREYMSLFEELGFESSLLPYEGPMVHEMKVVLTLLPVFRKLYGHGCVPNNFKVPATEEWPKEWYGSRLGHEISVLRKDRVLLSLKDQHLLEKEGMVWTPINFEVDQVHRGITTFKTIYKNVDIPRGFVVPHEDTRWGRDLWGLRLGSVVYDIRHNGHMKEHQAKFLAMGLEIQEAALTPSYPFELVCEALKAYKAQCGTLKVQRRFVIDAEDTAYPKEVRGMKLGEIVRSMKVDALYADCSNELKAMGISLTESEEHAAERICEALRCYYQINPPDARIGNNFFIPSQAPYPKHMWDFALGRRIFEIRHKGYLSQYRDRFEAAGLRFDTKAPAAEDNRR